MKNSKLERSVVAEKPPLLNVAVPRDVLLSALRTATRIISKRNSTIPIFDYVVLRTHDYGSLEIRSTDCNLCRHFSVTIPCESNQVGAIAIGGRALVDLLKGFPKGERVKIVELNGKALVAAGFAEATLPTAAVEDFPEWPAELFTHTFAVPASGLRDILSHVAFAISTEETRYYLNGIYFHVLGTYAGPVLRGVATDGHKLARYQVPAPEEANGMPGVIVPTEALTELGKMVSKNKGDVAVRVGPNRIEFATGTVVLASRLINGTFPDYNRVIPTANRKWARLNRKETIALVRRIASGPATKFGFVAKSGFAAKFGFADGKLTVSVNNPDLGTAQGSIDCCYDDMPLDIGLNTRYVIDILSATDSDTVAVWMADCAPVLIESEDSAWQALLMPLHI